jgi:hypothetical protein
MQKIYEPQNMLEGELLQRMLASEGIDAYVSGGHLLGGMGELPALGLLAISVDNHQVERARELITAYNGALPFSGDEPDHYPDVLVC